MESELIAALRRAVAAVPTDVALRLHLAEQLRSAGDLTGAAVELAAAVEQEPSNAAARAGLDRVMADLGSGPAAAAAPEVAPVPDATATAPISDATATDVTATADVAPGPTDFDWSAAEEQVEDLARPMFVDGEDDHEAPDEQAARSSSTAPMAASSSKFSVEQSKVTLADVGGLKSVKERLNAAFLAPLTNPKLRKLYAKSLRGGLLLYGPPGCGKTYIARALAGELGAKFLSVGIADILDPYFGQSERNLHDAFGLARRESPCVLFFDEVDALGARRSNLQSSMLRGVVNQLLTELDGVDGLNEGVFVLAATNQPWDVDPALRRPGRLDRTVLVLPPDIEARAAIFRHHLSERPLEGIDLKSLAAKSEQMSGADIAYVCEVAAEHALLDGVATGDIRPIRMPDLMEGLAQTRPSIGPWLDSARNVVLFGDDDGTYTELRGYLKKNKRL